MVKVIHGDLLAFQCEICKQTYKYQGDAERCEAGHTQRKVNK